MARRKALTRAESQAVTREQLVDSAEKLFLANGYHATSIATIAADCGRTVGAVYSNYASKEELCCAVLRRRFTAEIAKALAMLTAAGDDLDARLEAIAQWWREFARDTPMLLLTAEYGLSLLRDPNQRDKAAHAIDSTVDSVRVMVDDHLPSEAARAHSASFDRAANAITAFAIGLSTLRGVGTLGERESTAILTESIRMWIDRVAAETHLPA
ncbi:TetR/AcrR family transcriptional regulator [Gordonia sp. TBRC 11910]|uniref:TetR/AcrR family transcriptional regulator n=1 Tax=Gordonia asplenii TaxID=2725283 RepID=A0A848KX19_9ACTN|nr:TetR/AcrR family transcriptional regulator [Gordonia asplenii]NMO00731.1 TetR/AcrR family transcriptional regulator [Gordonia asplenii]